ncbi:LYR motif-containing protein 5 [Balamuthia mandrillaris]
MASATATRDVSRAAVKRLYKNILWAGKDYPAGQHVIREGTKRAFFAMKDETDPQKIQKAIEKGEYVIKELEALHKLHKYRTLRRAYSPEHEQEMVERLHALSQAHSPQAPSPQ